MVQVVRIILIVAVVYFGIRIIDRFIIPYLFPGRRKGSNDTTISGSENRKKRFSKEDGDYVDYEEMK